MQESFRKIKSTLRECLQTLRSAPAEIRRKLTILLSEFDEFITSRPNSAQDALPIALNILHYLEQEKYAEAIIGLGMLLALARNELRRRRLENILASDRNERLAS